MLNILFYFLFIIAHPIHVSVSNIDYSERKKSFNISLKIFTNDLETAIENKYNIKLKIGKPDENVNSLEYINKYITDNYSITINNKNKTKNKLVFRYRKIIEDSIWLFYEFQGVKNNVRNISIKNSILHETYKDQNNLLIINYFDFQKGYNFICENDFIKINL